MVRDTGFEPVGHPSKIKASSVADSPYYSPSEREWAEWVEITQAWPLLPAPLRAAVLALVRSHNGRS